MRSKQNCMVSGESLAADEQWVKMMLGLDDGLDSWSLDSMSSPGASEEVDGKVLESTAACRLGTNSIKCATDSLDIGSSTCNKGTSSEHRVKFDSNRHSPRKLS